MAEDVINTDKLPNQLNLKEIAEGITRLNEANSLIIGSVSQSVQKFSSLTVKNINTAVSNLDNLSRQMGGFIQGVSKLLGSFKKLNFNQKDINDILMYQDAQYELERVLIDGEYKTVNYADPSTRKLIEKEAAGFKIGQVIMMLATTVAGMTKPIETINKQKHSIFTLIKFKHNISILAGEMESLLKYTSKALSNVSISGDEFTEMILGTKDAKVTNKKTTKDGDISEYTRDIPGKYGVVEALLKVAELPAALNNMEFAHPVKTRIKLKILIDQISGLVTLLGNEFKRRQNLIDTADKSMKPLIKVFEGLTDISETIDVLVEKSIVAFILQKKKLKIFFEVLLGTEKKKKKGAKGGDAEGETTIEKGIIGYLSDIYTQWSKANPSNILSAVSNINDIMGSMAEISTNIAKLSILGLPLINTLVNRAFIVIVGDPESKKSKGVIDWLITMDRKLQDAELDNVSRDINSLKVAVLGLAKVTATILLVGLMAIPAVVAMIPVLLLVTGLSLMFKLLGDKAMRRVIGAADKNINKIALSVLLLSSAVLLLVLTGLLITKGLKELGIVLLFLAATVATFFLLALASRIIKEGGEEIIYIGLAILLLSLSVMLLALTGLYIKDNIDKILMTALLLGAVVAAAMLLAFASKWIEKGTTQIILIAVAVLILSVAVNLLVLAANSIDKDWSGILKIGALILGMVALAAIIGIPVVAALVGIGSAVIAALAVSMILMSTAILVVTSMNVDYDKAKKDVLTLASIFSDLSSFIMKNPIFILGPLSMIVIGSATAIFTMESITLLLMGSTVKLIQSMNIDFKKAGENIRDLLGVFIETDKTSGRSFLGMLEKTKIPISATWKMRRLANISKSIGNMAKVVTNIANLRMVDEIDKDGRPIKSHNMTSSDFKSAALNGIAVAELFIAMFRDEDKPVKISDGKKVMSVTIQPIKEQSLEKVTRSLKRKMKRIGSIVNVVAGMADTVQSIAQMRIPESFDKDGKPKTWRAMGTADFVKASFNIGTIMTFMVTAVALNAERLEDVKKKNIKKVQLAMESTGPVCSMVDTIRQLAEGSIPKYKTDENGTIIVDKDGNPIVTGYIKFNDYIKKNKKNIENNIKDIMSCISDATYDIINDKNFKEKLDSVEDFADDYAEPYQQIIDIISNIKADDANAAAFEKTVASSERLFKQIDSVNLSKLRTAASLFGAIAHLSKSINGNFDKLADAINEKLIKALEELEEVLDEIQKDGINVKTSSSSNSTSQSASNAISANNSKDKGAANKNTKNNAVDIAEIKLKINNIESYMEKLAGTIIGKKMQVLPLP